MVRCIAADEIVRAQRGDHATRVAIAAGFRELRTVWDHPNNADLGSRRNPNVLAEGDELFVPERELRDEEAVTTRRHNFVVRRTRLRLRVQWEDWERPVRGPVLVKTATEDEVAPTAEGLVDIAIAPDLRFADLRGRIGTARLWVGGLEPIEAPSGVGSRLHNLGYLDGGDWQLSPAAEQTLRSAVEEFQCDEGLTVNGVADDATRARLLLRHGI